MSVGADAASPLEADTPHEITLLLRGRCRACAELLPGGQAFGDGDCPRCGERPLVTERERAVLAEVAGRRGELKVAMLGLALLAANLVIGWFPLLSSLLAAASTAVIRFQIVRPIARLLGPGRRPIAVWTARILSGGLVGFALVGNELLTLLPFVGGVVKGGLSTVLVVVVAGGNARYLRWQLERERKRQPVAIWEPMLLVGGVVLLIGVCVAVAFAVYHVVLTVESLAGGLLS